MYNYLIYLSPTNTSGQWEILQSENQYTAEQFSSLFNEAVRTLKEDPTVVEITVDEVARYLVDKYQLQFIKIESAIILEYDIDEVNTIDGNVGKSEYVEKEIPPEELEELHKIFTKENEKEDKCD